MTGRPEPTQPEPEPEAEPPEPSSPVPPVPRPRWRQIVLAVVILLCGFLMGAGATVLTARKLGWRPPARPRTQVGQQLTERMREELNLRPDQEGKIREIVQRRLKRVYELRDESRKEAQQELNAMRDEVAQVLDADQNKRWNERWERMRRLGPKYPRHGGPQPPRGPSQPGSRAPGQPGFRGQGQPPLQKR